MRVGSENFLVEVGVAGEIVPLADIAPGPWTKRWYRGLANVRGRLIGVVDLLQLTRRDPLPPDQAQQILVFGEALSVNAGILITRAFGIRNLKDLSALPPAGEPEHHVQGCHACVRHRVTPCRDGSGGFWMCHDHPRHYRDARDPD